MAKALVVISGGQDSCICLYWAKKYFEQVEAITFDYHQRHNRELVSAIVIADLAKVPHRIVELPLGILAGRSPLTDLGQPLEQYPSAEEMDKIIGDRIELTFVPMRNAFFLTLAANRAICMDAMHLVAGVCQEDNANYPDCRELFIQNQQYVINLALGLEDPTENAGWIGTAELGNPKTLLADDFNSLFLHTPLIHLPKDQALHKALEFEGCYTALGYSHTAYDNAYPPTGSDHATVLRAKGFAEAGIPDPLLVRAAWEGLIPMPETPNYSEWDLPEAMPEEAILPALVELESELRKFYRVAKELG